MCASSDRPERRGGLSSLLKSERRGCRSWSCAQRACRPRHCATRCGRLIPRCRSRLCRTFESRLASRLAKDRLASGLTGFFAVVALVLTAIGIYGVVSWVVRHATREIGLRMALGATRPRVLREVLWRGLLPVLVGLVVGGGASLAVSGYFVGLVVGATKVSASVMIAAAGMLMLTAIVAACLPARRAMAIDPAVALRME